MTFGVEELHAKAIGNGARYNKNETDAAEELGDGAVEQEDMWAILRDAGI